MSFHPEQYVSHVRMHTDELREQTAQSRDVARYRREQRFQRSARRQARCLEISALALATVSGWFGGLAVSLHSRARQHRTRVL